MRISRLLAFAAVLLVSIGAVGSIAAQQENPPLGGNRPYLGVVIERAEAGALVTEVLPDSPAEAAGVVAGDIIVSVNDVSITDRGQFFGLLRTLEIGTEITLNVIRDGTNTSLTAELSAEPEDLHRRGLAGRLAQNRLGIAFNMTPEGAEVVNVRPDSRAAEVGFQQGDVITAVDGQPVSESTPLRDLVLSHAPGDTITFSIVRDGAALDLTWTIPTLRDMMDAARQGRGLGDGLPFGGGQGAPFSNPTPVPGASL